MKFIIEHATYRNDLKLHLASIQDELVKHLMLCFIFRDSETVNHWKNEVAAFLRRVPLLKDNKHPGKDFIYHYIFGEIEDSFLINLNSYLEDIEDDEDVLIPEFNTQNLYNFIREYCTWVATQLSSNLNVSRSDVNNKINDLLEKYKK